MAVRMIQRPLFLWLWPGMRLALLWGCVAACLAFFSLTATPAWSQPSSATHPGPVQPTLKIVGGLAGVAQFNQLEAPFWTQELARLSGGKYTASMVAFDRAGVPGSEMLRLIQLGVVPFGTVLMSSLSGSFPRYAAPDLAGLNLDFDQLRTSLRAFRPYLDKALREEQGIELLALYIYPAQMVFCKKPLKRLAELRGRRVRVSSASQADFVSAFGAIPSLTAFDQIVSRLETGGVDCAVTGTLSGSAIGLQRLTTDVYQLPINWGMAIFGANRAAWLALPPDLRALLQAELPKLEARIWAQSERDTAQGLACLSGKIACPDGTSGAMQVASVSAQDRQIAEQVFAGTVLLRWLQRCGTSCADIWNTTLGPARGVALPAP